MVLYWGFAALSDLLTGAALGLRVKLKCSSVPKLNLVLSY